MGEELKPCPFCGGEATIRCFYPIDNHYPLHEEDVKSPIVYVGCKNCGIDIQYTPDFWNTRPAEQYLKKCSDIYKATVFNLKHEIEEYKSKILINGCHTSGELGLYKILEKLLTTISFTWDEKGERGRE